MQIRGTDGIKQLVSQVRNAFPDIHFLPQIVVAELDKASSYFKWAAAMKGSYGHFRYR